MTEARPVPDLCQTCGHEKDAHKTITDVDGYNNREHVGEPYCWRCFATNKPDIHPFVPASPALPDCQMCHGARLTSTGEPCPDCPDVPHDALPEPPPSETMGLILEPHPTTAEDRYTLRGSRDVRTRDSDGQREIRDLVSGDWIPYYFKPAAPALPEPPVEGVSRCKCGRLWGGATVREVGSDLPSYPVCRWPVEGGTYGFHRFVPPAPALPVEGDALSDEDREWMDAPMGPPRHRSIATQLGAIYDDALVLARAYAHKHGYALAVHGSEMRDLDLIAVPWTDEASDAETLVEAIREAVGGRHGQHPDEQRPHGRRSWSIHLNNERALGNFKPVLPYLDLSVMPRAVGVEPVEGDDSDPVEIAYRAIIDWFHSYSPHEALLFDRLDAAIRADERRVAEERIAELEATRERVKGALAEINRRVDEAAIHDDLVLKRAYTHAAELLERALSKPAQEADERRASEALLRQADRTFTGYEQALARALASEERERELREALEKIARTLAHAPCIDIAKRALLIPENADEGKEG